MTQDAWQIDDLSEQKEDVSKSGESLGSFLRKNRLRQNKDVEEVAKDTRIHASTILAIEENNSKALPAEVFTRGFIKIYAQYLGLDPKEALNWHVRQSTDGSLLEEKINVQEVLSGETFAESAAIPLWRRMAYLFAAIGLALACYWTYSNYTLDLSYLGINEQTAPATVEAPPATTQPQASSGALQPPTTGEGSTAGGSLPAPSTAEDGALTPAQPGTEITDHNSVAPAANTASDAKPSLLQPGASATEQNSVPVSPPPTYVLAAEFTKKTRVKIKIDDEKTRTSTYFPGDHPVWKAEEKIELQVENAGSIALTLNDTPMPPIGKPGKTARVIIPKN